MKKIITLSLILLLIVPLVKADGIPYPPISPYISEEHQIVLVEQKGNKIITTLDLGIKARPENIFSILEENIYISGYNPVWLKTFLLPEEFEPEQLCIISYDFRYYQEETSPVEVTINDNIVYLYTKEGNGNVIFAEKKIMPPPQRRGYTYCNFTRNQNMSDPEFVEVSEFFEPGEYNTIEIRTNTRRGFGINGIYLKSGEAENKVKIIIPFKTMPESIEIGGQGINIWELEYVFRDRREWYGYYGGRLLSTKEAPALAREAQTIERSTQEVISRTEVSADVSGKFEGKVSDLLGTVSTKGLKVKNEYLVVRFADVSYEAYLNHNAYVIELTVEPFKLKRVVIKWVEAIENKNDFDYWYPLGTGQTWSEKIPYTAIYVKLPEKNAIKFSNIPGKEEATRGGYRYYRWKFIEDNPDKDLYITVEKLTKVEEWIHEIEAWLKSHAMILVIVGGLFILGMIISVRSKPRGRGL